MTKIIAIDVDPTAFVIRGRDTEYQDPPTTEGRVGEWSAWQALDAFLATPGAPTLNVAVLCMAAVPGSPGMGRGPATLSLTVVAPDGTLIRTTEYQVGAR